MHIILRGSEIMSEHDLERALASQLHVRLHAVNVREQLQEYLSLESPRPLRITWNHSHESRVAMGQHAFEAWCNFFRDLRQRDLQLNREHVLSFELE